MQHLLLLHGAIGAKDQLRPIEEKLKGFFFIHLLNFSGHGGQSMIDSFSIEQFSEDTLNYMQLHNIKKANILDIAWVVMWHYTLPNIILKK